MAFSRSVSVAAKINSSPLAVVEEQRQRLGMGERFEPIEDYAQNLAELEVDVSVWISS